MKANPLKNGSGASILAMVRSPLVLKTIRYASVSVISLAIGQALLITFKGLLDWPGTTANVASVLLSAIPAYLLNRYWTWERRGRNDVWREVAPFWAMVALGLAFSTWLVALADQRWGTTFAVSAANLVAFGTIWVGKFLVLNYAVWAQRPSRPS